MKRERFVCSRSVGQTYVRISGSVRDSGSKVLDFCGSI